MKRFFFGLCLVGLLYVSLTMWQGQTGKSSPISIATISHLMATIQPGHQVQSGTSVEGKPTIGASFINTVLAAAGSPAKNTGQALYDLGVKYGIDPVYALAFFMHESTFGTAGVARATLSLGNIRCTPSYLCIEGYRAYSTWQQGYEDWYKLIRNLYLGQWHLSTVEQIVPKYAPSSDHNDVAGYIAAVEKAVSTWRAGQA